MITTRPSWLISLRTVMKCSGPERPCLRAELACQVRRVASAPDAQRAVLADAAAGEHAAQAGAGR